MSLKIVNENVWISGGHDLMSILKGKLQQTFLLPCNVEEYPSGILVSGKWTPKYDVNVWALDKDGEISLLGEGHEYMDDYREFIGKKEIERLVESV